MKTAYRVAVVLAWLAAVAIVSAGGAAGNAAHWQVLDAGSVVGQGSDDGTAGIATHDSSGLYAAYMDQRASIDRSRSTRSDARGIVGLLVNHELAVAVTVTFAGVAIAVWAIRRGSYRGT